jgi:lipopolysaccharide export system permease protein
MKLLDRYILKQFLSAYVFVVVMLLAIVTVIDYTEKVDEFMEHQLTSAQILGYYKNFLPFIANLVTPITVFIATVFVTSRLAGRTEIIAMLSSGISFRRLMLPYLMGALIISGLSFYMTGWVIPDGNKEKVAFETKYIKGTYYFSDRDIHIKVDKNSYLYLQSYNNRTDIAYRPTLETIEDNQLLSKVSASRMEWDEEKEKWVMKNWKRIDFEAMGEKVTKGSEMDTTIRVHPKDFGSTYHLNETFTIPELDEYIAELQARGADNVQEYRIEKYVRYMSPFAVLVLTFIGIIVSARKTRGGTGLQIAIGFTIAFIFIIFFIMSRAIAETEMMNPILSVWLPNISFSLIGLLLYSKLPR